MAATRLCICSAVQVSICLPAYLLYSILNSERSGKLVSSTGMVPVSCLGVGGGAVVVY